MADSGDPNQTNLCYVPSADIEENGEVQAKKYFFFFFFFIYLNINF